MADGLCTGDAARRKTNAIEDQQGVKVKMNRCCREDTTTVCARKHGFCVGGVGDGLCPKQQHDDEGFLAVEDDCRKKRCVDRYDSSESSDSGVAVLSCTDCSGSSTASSDITDPGSPFSTGSNHSEDSASQPPPQKMPPTVQQHHHHPPWPWAGPDEGPPPPLKRSSPEKAGGPTKRLKVVAEDVVVSKKVVVDGTSLNDKLGKGKKPELSAKMQQGKITEYFKAQMKCNGIKRDLCADTKKAVDAVKAINGIVKSPTTRSANPNVRKVSAETKCRKPSPVSVPRKILPAPSKVPDKIVNHIAANFSPTVTLTAVSFPPNLTYLHTKTPKPPDNIFVQQFATITNDKINTIPIVNRTCLLQPIQKITAINNFNCVKLNGTVVPIVKLNAMPSRLNGSNIISSALSVETAVPTVLSTKPKVNEPSTIAAAASPVVAATPPETATCTTTAAVTAATPIPQLVAASVTAQKCSRTPEEQLPTQPDSDSGISGKDHLEVSVTEPVTVECQKSPILSQPKTIRFPAKQQDDSKKETRKHTTDSIQCRWDNCHAHFDTSGALLEHLQVKHVISQANQEHYVCFWTGCKVHGRTSCSRSWLERHVLAHAGTKPFRCIVDGCGLRFNSQLSLERHVNNHFNTEGSQSGSSKKSVENGSIKLFRRNGKRLRFRRQPWSARMFDFIDPGIMEGLQHQLLTMTEKRTLGQFSSVPGDTVSLQSQILARRTEPDGKTKVLVRWHPQDVLPDEWMDTTEYKSCKTVPIPSLKPSAKDALKPLLFEQPANNSTTTIRRKHRRKPVPVT